MAKNKRKRDTKGGPVRVYETENAVESNKKSSKDMRPMAGRVVKHHTQSYPEAEWPQVPPFPKPLLQGLAWGTLVGMLLGILWAALMLNGALVIPGWDGLFSMTPFTFYVFWAMAGAGLGIIVIGVALILIAPVSRTAAEQREEGYEGYNERVT